MTAPADSGRPAEAAATAAEGPGLPSDPVRLTLSVDEASIEPMARLLLRHGEHAALRRVLQAMVERHPGSLRHWVRLFELAGSADAPDASRQRAEMLESAATPPALWSPLLQRLRALGDDRCVALLQLKSATASQHPLRSVRTALALLQGVHDGPRLQRAMAQAAALIDSLPGLSARDYLSWTKITDEAKELVDEEGRAALVGALARALVRHPEAASRVGALLGRLAEDEAKVALARELAASGSAIGHDQVVQHLRAKKAWPALARLHEVTAGTTADAVPVLQRAALYWERAGRPADADRIYSTIEPEIRAHRSLADKAATLSTLMFRNPPVLQLLVRLIAYACTGRSDPLRVHVAAVSSGEEAYSLAIALHDAGLLDRVALEASDVDAASVARAQRGRINRRLLAKAPQSALSWFSDVSESVVCLDARMLGRIRFGVWDLLSDGLADRRADILVANNLSVHLDAADKHRLIASLAKHTPESGVVVMGGDVHDEQAQAGFAEAGLFPLRAWAAACHEAWGIQRNAWYVLPRPYWALPPFRKTAPGDARFATFFARNAEQAAALDAMLATAAPLPLELATTTSDHGPPLDDLH